MSELPVAASLPQIFKLLHDNRPLVLTAEPGAGKTTVLPPSLLDQTWLSGKKILLLEPRRVAAQAAARRMAQQLGEKPGETVGWRIAQDTCVGPRTRIEVLTEGILTRQLQDDPGLDGVALVLFDEFHERTLHGDLGLALTLDVRKNLRPDLRIGLLSATLDADQALKLLGNDAAAVHSPGRTFPVETLFKPPLPQKDPWDAVVEAVKAGWQAVDGDLLIFLPGRFEIRRVAERLSSPAHLLGEVVQILHGGLSSGEQAEVLTPLSGGRRKTVLSTSVAETSLTLPGVSLVIDSGWARLNRFDPKRAMDRLVTERLSQASADQRRGRAGRTQAGSCWRLWSQDEKLSLFTAPEIQRADLSSLVLECAAWGVTKPDELEWMTPPPPSLWSQARDLLSALDVLDEHSRLNERGRETARLGLGPRLGRMVLEADPADRELALLCAVGLQERDSLQLGAETDFRVGLETLAKRLNGESKEAGFERARELLRQLRQKLKPTQKSSSTLDLGRTGLVLTLAFPDRLARRIDQQGRSGPQADFLLANGRSVRVRGALAQEEFLVVPEADAGESTGTAYLAAPVQRGEVLALFKAEKKIKLVWTGWRTQAFRVVSAGVLEIEKTGLALSEAVEQAKGELRLRLKDSGESELPWTSSSRAWYERALYWASRTNPRQEVLLQALTQGWEFLADYAVWDGGPVVTEESLSSALRERLDWKTRERLDSEAPSHLIVPSGSRKPLVYRRDGPPVVEVRLQEVFGLASSPLICGLPVIFHLLSPAQRPLQVTSDLASFWRAGYQEVRKEMRGRYPRHYWPENPLEAEATSRVKPRQ